MTRDNRVPPQLYIQKDVQLTVTFNDILILLSKNEYNQRKKEIY